MLSAVRTARNHYDVLGLAPTATQQEIAGAFNAAMGMRHRDLSERGSMSIGAVFGATVLAAVVLLVLNTGMHTSVSWLDLMATEEVLQYERLLADPAVPARVLAQRDRLDATLCVHRARVAFRDREPVEMARQFARALGRDPRIWEHDQPLTAFARSYVARRTP